jgi:predicted nucleic acid-binding protein
MQVGPGYRKNIDRNIIIYIILVKYIKNNASRTSVMIFKMCVEKMLAITTQKIAFGFQNLFAELFF